MKQIVLLIDADSIIYSACLASKEEDEDGFQRDLDEAKLKLDNIVHGISSKIEDMGIDNAECVLFVEGKGNFRKAFTTSYKRKRKERQQPPLRDDLTNYVLEHYNSFQSVGCETDDSISITWQKYKDKYDLIICSIDKDLKMIPCAFYDYYYNRDDDKRMFVISEEDAERNFWSMMLIGDAADEVNGVPKIGKVGAEKILKGSVSRSQMAGRVYRAYLKAYGVHRGAREFWKAYFLMKLPNKGFATPDLDSLFIF